LSTLSVISVIDDDASVRAATNNLLTSHGYMVHTFASAEEFLQSTRLKDTSCVIADVQMPAMSGLDLLILLRTQGYRAPYRESWASGLSGQLLDPQPTFDWPRRRLNLDLVEEVTMYRHSLRARARDNVN